MRLIVGLVCFLIAAGGGALLAIDFVMRYTAVLEDSAGGEVPQLAPGIVPHWALPIVLGLLGACFVVWHKRYMRAHMKATAIDAAVGATLPGPRRY